MQSSFSAHVQEQARRYGEERGYTFVRDDRGGELISQRLSYRALDVRARELAAWLGARGAAERPVLLLFPAGLDFVQAFVGCTYAGAIAVPAPVPGDPRSLERVAGIVADTELDLVLTTSALRESLAERFAELELRQPVEVVAVDEVHADAADWKQPELTAETIAFLQYTSGSTSEPKGVVVTHGNLLHNLSSTQQVIGSGDDLVMVGWLPHFHDMGLIGLLLQPLYVGGDCVFMAPTMFLKRPVRWMEVVTRWRGTLTVAPDFAYDMCSRTITDAQLAELDLSTLRAVMNGAEPVRAATLERFAERFAAAGLRPGVFAPCYGMAEVTLMATVSPGAAPIEVRNVDRRALERDEIVLAEGEVAVPLIGCGRPETLTLRIVDPHSHEVREPGQIGEIWLRGGSVAAGYWRRPETNREIFGARTADGEGPFLRTGDLGALVDEQLFVTGRLKDVLIFNGRNVYPQDIEHAVRELHPALAAGVGVAFGITAGREHVVVVQEVKEALLRDVELAGIAAQIKVAVARAFDIASPGVVLTSRGTVKRTTSGKVQRGLMRELFLTGAIKVLHQDLPGAVGELVAREVTAGQAS